jgi:hypothetical protein
MILTALEAQLPAGGAEALRAAYAAAGAEPLPRWTAGRVSEWRAARRTQPRQSRNAHAIEA